MEHIKKVIIFTYPAVGHSNPILAFCTELLRSDKFKVIIYSQNQFKDLIQNLGAEYRGYDKIKISLFDDKIKNKNPDFDIIQHYLESSMTADKIIKQLYHEVLVEKPDLIIYDNYAYYAKILSRYILKELKKTNNKIPKLMAYTTSFHFTNDYPNSFEQKMIKSNVFKTLFNLILMMLQRIWLIIKYGFDFSFLLDNPLLPIEDEMNLVFTFSQLQPRSHLLDSYVQFIGCSFDSVMHHEGEGNDENILIKAFLKELEERHNVQKPKHLVFASLGTIFNRDKEIYLKLIEAFKNLINESKDFEFNFILSTGKYVYDILNELEKPKEILFVKSAPQIEILMRASLFITHSGMNSTSEAIHFGVPMVCLPNAGDQPLVAYRISDELGLGIRLDTMKFKPIELQDAIKKIIADSSFKKRASLYQKFSNDLIGSKNFAQKVLKVLN